MPLTTELKLVSLSSASFSEKHKIRKGSLSTTPLYICTCWGTITHDNIFEVKMNLFPMKDIKKKSTIVTLMLRTLF